jgi:hypothetical protein
MVFDNGPDTNEDQSRLINCAITGVFLNGSILTNSSSVSLAQMCLTNAAINTVARVGQTFLPVECNTGTGAGTIFTRQDGSTWCIAVFNYTSEATNETVTLSRVGLPAGTFVATNLWDGTSQTVSSSFNVSLNEKQAKLFRLTLASTPPKPGFSDPLFYSTSPLTLSGTNGIPGWPVVLLTATNLSTPLSQWTPVATNQFDANGNFSFTIGPGPGAPQQFYLLETP